MMVDDDAVGHKSYCFRRNNQMGENAERQVSFVSINSLNSILRRCIVSSEVLVLLIEVHLLSMESKRNDLCTRIKSRGKHWREWF
jgi:hypothetical protein